MSISSDKYQDKSVRDIIENVLGRIDPDGIWRAIRFMRHAGTYTTDVESGSYTYILDLHTRRSCYTATSETQTWAFGCDHAVEWNRYESGSVSVHRHPGRLRKSSFRTAMFELQFLFMRDEFDVSVVDTADNIRLAVRPRHPSADDLTKSECVVVIDPNTWLVTELINPGSIDEEVLFMSDWRDCGGWWYPFVSRSEYRSGSEMQSSIEVLEVVPSIDDDEFAHPPTIPGYASFETPCSIPVTMPHNHMHVPVILGGVERDFILDTGAARSLVAREIAEQLDGIMHGEVMSEGMGGLHSMRIVELPELRFGTAVYRNCSVSCTDLTSIRYGLPTVDGIIGQDILRDFVVTIDVAKNVVTLSELPRESPPIDDNAIRLDENACPVEVNGVMGLATIDTGAFLPTLHTWFAREALASDVASAPAGMANFGIGPRGSATADVVCREIRLGIHSLTNVPARASVAESGPMSRRERLGNIGGMIWSRFRMTLDLANECMWLEPNESFDEPFDYHPTGVRLGLKDSVAVVMGLVPESCAVLGGLEVG
ncbi:MAG: aspartyl protease family protein, partial [bacterium]|nr:aspartyl protease family protein [Candidatus Kapabacteria bacterium]